MSRRGDPSLFMVSPPEGAMRYEDFLIRVEMYAYLDRRDLESLTSQLLSSMEELGLSLIHI